MKLKAFGVRRASPLANSITLSVGFAIATATLGLDTAHATSATWDGGAATNILNTAANWTGDVVPNASGDIATFDEMVAGDLSLSWTGGFGAAPNGTTISVTSGHTGSLLIGSSAANGGNATTNLFALGNISIASGVGAFTFGDSDDLDNIVFRNPDGTNAINTLTNNSSNTATFASNVRFNSGGGSGRSLIFGGTGNWQIDATWQLGGSGGLNITKNDSGTLKITNSNSGATGVPYTINGGALDFNSGTQTTGTITLAGDTATLQNGNLTTGTINANSATGESFVSNIASTGILSKGAAGTLTLSGTNSFASAGTTGGTVQINGGSTSIAAAFAYNSPGTTLTVTAGSLTTGSITANANSDFRNLNLNGGSLSSAGNVFASGTAIAVNFNGGTLKSGNAAGITIFDANNTFEVNVGGATLDTTTGNITTGTNASSANVVKFNGTTGGTLTVTGGNTFKSAVTNTGALALQNGSTWDMDGDSTVASSLGGLSGASGTVTNTGAAKTLALNVTAGSQTFGGGIGGGANVAVTKTGAGTQTISGTNAFDGNLTVSGGTLALSGNSTLGGELLVNGGATLELTGTNTLTDTTPVVQSGATLSVDSISDALGGITGIQLGGGSNTGRLLYTGAGETTGIEVASSAFSAGSGIILDQSGTGTLEFTNIGFMAGISSFTLQGSTAGEGMISDSIPDTFGGGMPLIKNGSGTWTLSGSNSYTGSTTVIAGTLSIQTATLADSAAVDVKTDAVLNLDFSGTDVVGDFKIDGVSQGPGIYNSANTGGLITGDGELEVLAGGGYSSWATTNVGDQTPGEDFNNDGVDNGIAYFMNNTGTISLPGIVGGAVTWTNGGNIAAAQYGTEFVVQTSQDLVNWTDVPSGSLTTNTDGPGGSLTYTLPTGQGKWFVRLVVTPN